MAWTFCNGRAISKQIADRIAVDILMGAVLPQQRLPALEEMSKVTGVSARTVSQAYDELVEAGIVEKHEFLIIPSDKSAAEIRRNNIAHEAIIKLTGELNELGLTRAEQLKLFGEILVEQSRNDDTPEVETETE